MADLTARGRRRPSLTTIFRGTGTVALGTAAGQGIVLAVTPLLARIYSPAEFGSLALLMTVSNIAMAVSCARYDLALPGAGDLEASALLKATQLATVTVALLVLAITFFSHSFTRQVWPSPFDSPLLISSCVLFVGAQQAMIGLATREQRYDKVAGLRLAQGVIFSTLSALPFFGLTIAHAISFATAVPFVLRKLREARVSLSAVWVAAREKRDFPLMSLPGAILDVVGYSTCIWIIAHFYGAREAGQYGQIQRIVGAPLMLIGMSASQVLMRTSVDFKESASDTLGLVTRFTGITVGFGIAFLFIIGAWGNSVLRWLLGNQWRVDTDYILPIAIAVIVRACVSPVSTLLITLRRFDLALGWQSLYFVSSISVLGWVASQARIEMFVAVYAAHEVTLYAIYFLLIVKAVRESACAAFSA